MSDRTSSQADLLRSLAPAEPQQSQADKLRMLVDPTWNDVVRQTGESLVSGSAGVVDALAGLDQRIRGAIHPALAATAPSRFVRSVTKPYLQGVESNPAVTGEGDRFYAKVAQGIGSSAAFAPAAVAGPVGVGLMGATVGAEQGIEQAQAAGASTSDTVYSALGEALLGATEAFGAGRALTRFGLKPGTAAHDIVKDVLEEFVQESGQNIGSDVLAKATYDPQRKVDLGKALEAGLAASVGAGVISGSAALSNASGGHQEALLRAAAPQVTDLTGAAPRPDEPVVPASDATRTWAKEFAAQHGANLEFVDTLPDKARGRYDEKGKRIELSSNLTDEEVIRGTVLHEVARHMKATMGDTWQGMTERIREQDPVWWQKAGERYQADRAAAVGAASPESFDEDATSRYVDMAHGYILAAIEGKATPQPGILRSIADAVIRVLQKIGLQIDTSTEKALREYAASPWEKARDPKTMQAVSAEIAKAFQALQESAGKGVEDQAASVQTEPVLTRDSAPPPAPPATATPEAGAGGVSVPGEPSNTRHATVELGKPDAKKAEVFRDYARRQTRYMGNKREFLDKNADLLSRLDLSNVETVHDMYAGGGTYGLTYADSGVAPKVKRVVVNEFDPVRRAKFEAAVDGGGEFLRHWDTSPVLRELRDALRPLYRSSSSPGELAMAVAMGEKDSDVHESFIRFRERIKSESPEVRAAILAIRDVSFSGKKRGFDSLMSTAYEDANRVRDLYRSVRSKGIDVKVTSLDARSQEAIASTQGKGRSLVLLDPPYHASGTGTYSKTGSISIHSPEFMQQTLTSGERMAPGNIVIYHNKATPEVEAATRSAFGGSLRVSRWMRQARGRATAQSEIVGIYNGQNEGRAAGGVSATRGHAGRTQGVGEQRSVVEEVGSDTGRQSHPGAARGYRGTGGRYAGVGSGTPLVAETATEWNLQHEAMLSGLGGRERRKAARTFREERNRLVRDSFAASKQVNDRVRVGLNGAEGRVIDVTGPVGGQRVKVDFGDYIDILPSNELLLVDRPGQTTRTQEKRQRTADDDLTQRRERFAVAYHGSPYDFDKFSNDKIGTGEGAQAFGHGMYFTDRREIAEYYRKKLAKPGYTYDSLSKLSDDFDGVYASKEMAEESYGNAGIERVSKDSDLNEVWALDEDGEPEKYVLSKDGKWRSDRGKTYQVDLAPADDEYLLWDKPLSEQSEKVKAWLRAAGINPDSVAAIGAIGRDAYLARSAKLGMQYRSDYYDKHGQYPPNSEPAQGDRLTSETLRSSGIRGIKYLAGDGSRAKQEGTYNYVIFDPADIKITGKFAVAPREDTPEFKRWFGASKVVDASGNPLVVYHGTNDNLTEFRHGVGNKRDTGWLGKGFYFTNKPQLASDYTSLKGGESPQVLPVYLRLEKPYRATPGEKERIMLAEKRDPDAAEKRTWELRSQGYDGVLVEYGQFAPGTVEYVVFDPEQIKSATGNRGTFDPSNPDIRYAVAPSGSFDIPDDNRRRAFNRAVLDSFEALRLTPELDRAISLRPGLAYGHAERVQAQTIRGMIDVAKKVGREKADEYLYALHAPTRNAIIAERSKGKFGLESNPGSGMSNSEAARIVKAAGPEMTKLRDLNRRLNRERLDTLEKSGLLSAENRAEWEKFGEDYVPLRTADDPETRFGSTGSLNVVGPESKRAEGRKSKADSPMVFAVTSFTQAVERAERNRVGQMLADFVEANPTSEWGVYTSRDAIPEGHEVLSLKRNGAPVFIGTTNEAIASAFKQMDVAKAMGVMKAAGLFRRYMHNVIIKYNPAFSFSNAFRDIGTASAKLAITDGVKEAAKVVAYAPAAMRGSWSAIRKEGEGGAWGDWYREARDSGALVGWNEMASFQAVEDAMKQGRRTAILTLLEQANRAVELGTRVAFYRVLRESGADKQTAAARTRDGTTDFARRGNYSSQLSSLYLFFNANVQGTASMWRAAAAHPVRAAGVMGSLATVGYLLAVASRLYGDDYDKLTEMQKRRMGGVMVGNTMYGVPLPYGFDVFFYLGSRLETALSGQRTPDSLGEDVLEAAIQSFSPVQGANLGQALTPTIARPAMEIMQNQDFAGVPIRPQQSPFDRSPTPRSEQFFASVDPTLRKATAAMNRATGGDTVRSGAVDISPEDVEHVIKFLGGGVGSLIQRTVTAVSKGGDVRASDIPILRTFMGQAPESAIARIYYENLAAIEQETDARKKGEETRDARALELATFARNVDKRVKRLRELSKQNPEREKEYRATMREAMETLNLRMMQQ